MRFLKVFLIAVVVISIILTIIYSARISVINSLAKKQLSLAQIKITCLNFGFTSNMDIVVDKVCIHTPKAEIDIVDMTLQWQLSPKINITEIDVKLVNIEGIDHLFSNSTSTPQNKHNNESNQLDEHSPDNLKIRQSLSILRPYTEQIKQLSLPININVSEISYLPFRASSKPETSNSPIVPPPYLASLSAAGDTLYFSLRNSEKVEFIKVKLSNNNKANNISQGQEDFAIELSSNLTLLKEFVSAHQLPISKELQSTLNALQISGNLDTLIEYHADSIRLKNKITDIKIASKRGIGGSGAFKVLGTLNFESRFPLVANQHVDHLGNGMTDTNNAEIVLTFVEKNRLSLEYSQAHLFNLLEENDVSQQILTLMKDNPLTKLSFKVSENTTLTLNDEQINLSSINISAHSRERSQQISIENINLTLSDNNVNNRESAQTIQKLDIQHFVIDSQLKLENLSELTTTPVTLYLEGSLQKTAKQTELNFKNNSSVIVTNIVFSEHKNNANQNTPVKPLTTKGSNALLMLKTLNLTLAGKVQLLADNALRLSLTVDGKASKVHIPKVLQLKSFAINSDIKGSLNNIQIKANASADEIGLGTMVITGPALSPKVKLAASKVQLTDLLSLNIQLPIDINLIDGQLDYSILGEVTDLNSINDTPLRASVTVTSASGEVDGIWLQELNWQQEFTLQEGKVTTLPNPTENLTIELIDTYTPITKLKMNTNWTFAEHFQLSANKLNAEVLGGSFTVPNIQWPFEPNHSVNVQLESIDLEQVLALDKKQDIIVTGKISGQLDIAFDGDKYIIKDGELHNISNGLIQVIDTPSVAMLKENNDQLQLAFDVLKNLHYHQLSSVVSMEDDGYMILETVIKGRNPDIDNDVNLNLNVNYDLLGLLESLSITQRFEERLIKSLQKNKE